MLKSTVLGALIVHILSLGLPAQESSTTTKPNQAHEHVRQVVDKLCSEPFAGRSVAGYEVVRAFLVSKFKAAHLSPVNKKYQHKFAASGLSGVNIVGLLKSTHLKKAEGHIILSAHYDHLGRRGGRIYPGACDNASGVAAMLEIAGRLDPSQLRRDILFVAFDLEEKGLLGSFAYVKKPILPLEQCKGFITLDMLGRKSLGLLDNMMFVQGWEWTPRMLPILKEASTQTKIELSYGWTDVGGDRSDFVAFKRKRIPHLFFSVGENEDYHGAGDVASKIDAKLLLRQSRTVEKVLIDLANLNEPLVYRQVPDLNLIEFTSLRAICLKIAKLETRRIDGGMRQQAMMMASFAGNVVARKVVTSKDRQVLLRFARAMQGALR